MRNRKVRPNVRLSKGEDGKVHYTPIDRRITGSRLRRFGAKYWLALMFLFASIWAFAFGYLPVMLHDLPGGKVVF